MRIEITAETDPYADDYVALSYRVTVDGETLGAHRIIRTSDLMQESIFEILWEEVGVSLRNELKRHHKDGK